MTDPRKAASPAPIRATAAPANARAVQIANVTSARVSPDRTGVGDEVANRKEGRASSECAREEADRGAFSDGQLQQVAPRGAARAQEPQVSAIALDGAERGEVGKRQRDEGSRDGQHDVERLGVERVARGSAQAVSEVVDELHLARERPLDAVADLRRLLQRGGRASSKGLRVDLRLDLPLDPALGAGNRRRAGLAALVEGSSGANRCANVSIGMIATFAGG